MNRFSSLISTAATLIACVGMSACSNQTEEYAGIEGTGDKVASSGEVTQLGSIYVNGIHFNTDEAQIYINGESAADESELPGMIVNVEGRAGASATEAYALEVRAYYAVKAPIEAIQVDTDNLLYLTLPGYTVAVPEDTVFEGTSYDSLQVGDVIGVSGFNSGDATVYASRVNAETGDAIQISGSVSAADQLNKSFMINHLLIDYTLASLADTEENIIVDGTKVSVSGQLSEDLTTLIAEQVTAVEQLSYADATSVTEEGFAMNFDGASRFWLNGIEVDASSAEIEGGTLEDLTASARVSAAGSVQDNIISADSIQVILPSTIRTNGTIDTIDEQQRRLSVKDIAFYTDRFTFYLDDTKQETYFDLDDLRQGDQVEIYARRSESQNVWKATSIRRISANDKPFNIKGRITALEANGDFYLNELLVSVENIPEEQLFPYSVDQSVFVTGDISSDGVLLAEAIFPALKGCTSWDLGDCRPEPDDFDGGRGDDGDRDGGPSGSFVPLSGMK